jgi:hypothetical protein
VCLQGPLHGYALPLDALAPFVWGHGSKPDDPLFVDDHALLNHATMGWVRDLATFPAGPIRPRSERLVRNSANIQHAPIAVTL